MKLPFLFAVIALAGCNQAENLAVNACETFVKERLRSPATYNRVKADFSGVTFKSEGRDVKMVNIDYDAANAYGTPIRGTQQCIFEVDKSGNYSEDPDHAARMSSIGADLDIAPCCLLDEDEKLSKKTSEQIGKEADEALKQLDGAQDALENARNDAVKAAEAAVKNAEAK